LQEPRPTVQIGAGQIGRRPPGAGRHVDINDGVQGGLWNNYQLPTTNYQPVV
jgi:hypothetical protein